MPFLKYLPAALPVFLAAVPAQASAGTPLPEPSSLFLLAMGIAGVVLGRKFSSKGGD